MAPLHPGARISKMLNSQPVEKVVKTFSGLLDVHSIFHTIQGEGPFCGTPAVFVRLAGCNLQCPWCDTEYTEGRHSRTLEEIVATVRSYAPHGGLVVITGGEPFRQPVGPLLARLAAVGWYVQVESNGTLPPPQGVNFNLCPENKEGVYLVCSPKTGKVNDRIPSVACCYKYVLSADSVHAEDGLPLKALGHVANPHLARPPAWWRRPVYLQPADHKDPAINRSNVEAVVASAMKHGYTVQLQIHKYLGME